MPLPENRFLISNASIVNENKCFTGWVLVNGQIIEALGEGIYNGEPVSDVMDATGLLLLPGVIDCHVHFREPGLTHKADLQSETKAAVAGGVTSFFEMPNTQPQTLSISLLEEKMALASQKSLCNYSFFLGASNSNLSEILHANPKEVCGVKVFFGASTGNMLVDNLQTLEDIFRLSPVPVAAHCEDESIIKSNTAKALAEFGENIPAEQHPVIRSSDACYQSSKLAVSLAQKHGTRLHITHVSTEAETRLFTNHLPLEDKKITAEACVHYLSLNESDYPRLGMRMKVNPAIKSAQDQQALLRGLLDNRIDIITTDHAPHLLSEKQNSYTKAPSGTPLVQHALQLMLQLVKEGKLEITRLVDKMSHSPALCYQIEKRGYIREGYFADMVLVNPNKPYTVDHDNVLYKCGWSVFEGETFAHSIEKTFVNGNVVYDRGIFTETHKGMRIQFSRG